MTKNHLPPRNLTTCNVTALAEIAALATFAFGCGSTSAGYTESAGASGGNGASGSAVNGASGAGGLDVNGASSGGSGSSGGGSSAVGGSADAGTADALGDAGSQTSGGVGGDAGAGPAGSGAVTGPVAAYFSIQQFQPDQFDPEGSYLIYSSWGSSAGTACEKTALGPCAARVCDLTAADTTPTSTPPLDTGSLLFSGAGSAGATLVIDGTSTGTSGKSEFFSGGDILLLSGEGGVDLPAFGPLKLVAPSDFVLVEPVCNAMVCPALDRTHDLVVTWAQGGAGRVNLSLQTISSIQESFVGCSFEATAGSGSIPHELLELLEQAVKGTFRTGASNSVPFMLGGQQMVFNAQTGKSFGVTFSK